MTFQVLLTALSGVLLLSLLYMGLRYYKSQKFTFLNNRQYLWILIFVLGTVLRGSYILHPVDTESWRENDISLIAKNYVENGMNFFHPQVNWGNEPGYVESEFPLFPYLIALWYKIFGFYEPAGRIISFLFSIFALLVFFKLSQKLFDRNTALVTSLIFSVNPLPGIISTAIQSESMMFFFYICSAYYFLQWIENSDWNSYYKTAICTAMALLLKITAIHIGFLFVFLLLTRKTIKFILSTKVILLGLLCLVPSVLWYFHAHQFYLKYGNSLGISNEYSFMGPDFFTDPYFISGILKLEIHYVWLYSGILIVGLAIIFTRIVKQPTFIFACLWLLSISIFYAVASRTTADSWAYYYHIFSSVPASILIGFSLSELNNRFVVQISSKFYSELKNKLLFIGKGLIVLLLGIHIYFSYKALINIKNDKFLTSKYYYSLKNISEIIPAGTNILVSGYECRDRNGFPVAYNSSYFFYWLNCKGSNICSEDQSVQNIQNFHKNGINYFIAETMELDKKKGFTEELRSAFKVLYADNGIIVFKLDKQ